MKREQLTRKVGSMQQVAHLRPITFTEGRAKGMSGYDIKNGLLRFQVMADKCLDISECSYKGINLTFLAKQGLIGRMDYDTHGNEGYRNLMGGLLFTCGLENTCGACEENETKYPLHGRIRSTPAEHCQPSAQWIDGVYKLQVSGTVREAEMFGKNLTLERTIETIYGKKSITITDCIENAGFLPEPMMILYHFNFGYPLLDEEAYIILPTTKVIPRDKAAQKNAEAWSTMEQPVDGEEERVYLHELASDASGDTFAGLWNPQLSLGIKLEFNQKYLPYFVQWKSIASGDYVMGLEPTNSSIYGRAQEKNLHYIDPQEKEVIRFQLTILETEDEFLAMKEQAARLIENKN